MAYKVETTRDYKYLVIDWTGNGSDKLIKLLLDKYNIISTVVSGDVAHYILEKIDYGYVVNENETVI